jgi:translation initiation factor IF-3
VPEVRLVGPSGEQVGIVSITDALRLAQESDLDLVEVAPTARPPVCKLMDYGKFKYESALKARESRKNQTQTVIKEIKIRPKIDPHDYGTKRGHVERFLRQGDKVKVTIMFRGREQSRPELGYKLLQRLAVDVEELGFVESQPKQDGRNMIMVIGPHRKKSETKVARGPERASARAAAPLAVGSHDEGRRAEAEEPAHASAGAGSSASSSAVAATPAAVSSATASAAVSSQSRASAPASAPSALNFSRPAADRAAVGAAPGEARRSDRAEPRPAHGGGAESARPAAARPGPAATGPTRPAAVRPAAPRPAAPRPTAPRPTAPRPTAPRPTAPRPTAPTPAAPRPDAPTPAAPRPDAPQPAAPQPAAPRPDGPRPTAPTPAAAKPGEARPVPGPRAKAAEQGTSDAEAGS